MNFRLFLLCIQLQNNGESGAYGSPRPTYVPPDAEDEVPFDSAGVPDEEDPWVTLPHQLVRGLLTSHHTSVPTARGTQLQSRHVTNILPMKQEDMSRLQSRHVTNILPMKVRSSNTSAQPTPFRQANWAADKYKQIYKKYINAFVITSYSSSMDKMVADMGSNKNCNQIANQIGTFVIIISYTVQLI